MNRLLLISLLLFIFVTSCYEEMEFAPHPDGISASFNLNGKPTACDSEQLFMLYPVEHFGNFSAVLNCQPNFTIYIDGKYIEDGDSCHFGVIGKETESIIEIVNPSGKKSNYRLFFTTLPVVKFEYNYKKILDEPKGPSRFSMITHDSDFSAKCCGIETRGGTANRRPKKSFGFEFWNNYECRESRDTSLLDMYTDDDWILDAVYNDRSRMRNRVSFDIWDMMQRDALSRNCDVLYSSVKGNYVELFLNQEYQGLYCLSERVEGKMLGITPERSGQQGYLYKSEGWNDVTRLKELPDTTVDFENKWHDWEQKLPDPDQQLVWKPLYRFVDFMANSSDKEFCRHVNEYLVLDQVIDFYILINLIYGIDNVGKNYMLASRSAQSPFYILPWDMDATWGRNHRGDETKHNDVVKFRVFERLMKLNPSEFKQRLKSRYKSLREDKLSDKSLMAIFENYAKLLVESGAHQRNNSVWDEEKSDIQQELEYISDWLSMHSQYLDNYIDTLELAETN
ncbi:MAG: CotH kinase family protein [Prolixibacteraceae bacterium]|nr:CotH kinase family protein [Prolixibacteraceae bacterium]MBN2648790.1 CotH kinase family protein [Prolixibacteraceae bacterium]